ncbi:hypothetical protein AB1Y20_023738 [Prymnesium parvum]|uniref:ACB domain-containing protein n=1 Tax=Prymnesium parvum TaxID=97485 RepID=A0AB34JH95_PRYPA
MSSSADAEFSHVRKLCCDALYAEPCEATRLSAGVLRLSAADHLSLYGLVQCALVGSCKASRPPPWSSARARWEAWSSLGELPPHAAKARLLEFVRQLPGYAPPRDPPSLAERWAAWLWGEAAEEAAAAEEAREETHEWPQERTRRGEERWRGGGVVGGGCGGGGSGVLTRGGAEAEEVVYLRGGAEAEEVVYLHVEWLCGAPRHKPAAELEAEGVPTHTGGWFEDACLAPRARAHEAEGSQPSGANGPDSLVGFWKFESEEGLEHYLKSLDVPWAARTRATSWHPTMHWDVRRGTLYLRPDAESDGEICFALSQEVHCRTITGGRAVARSEWVDGALVVSITDPTALLGAAQVERHFVDGEGKLKIEVSVDLPPVSYVKTYKRA